MRPSFLIDSLISKQSLILLVLSNALAACAQVTVTPLSPRPPDPAVASDVIKAEPTPPTEIVVRDFEFSPSAVRENASTLHRFIDLFRKSSAEERRTEIARGVDANLSEQAVKRLNQVGLWSTRIPDYSNAPVPANILLVTGRLLDVDEGNRLTRIALGLGAGESRLDAEVHVFRVADGGRAEVLAFTTHADSGKMPGLIPSLGVGQLFIAPVTLLSRAKSAASTGEKIYSSQVDRLATKTGDQVARYLSQYSATEGWIPKNRAKSVNLAAR
jgi:hypothetical protein